MPLAASPGEGVEEGFSSGVVEGGALVVFIGRKLVFAPIDPGSPLVGVEVEYGFEVRPDSWAAEGLEADGLGRGVGLGLADCDEA